MVSVASSPARRFLAALDERGLLYCVWKGTYELSRAFDGYGDLDVLVDGDRIQEAREVLREAGLIEARGLGTTDPATSHHFGFDPSHNHPHHVHLYASLVTGESLIQTHRFPFEETLLEGAVNDKGIRVADPAAELGIFILRAMIKYGSLLERLWFGSRRNDLKHKARLLLQRTSEEAAGAWLGRVGVPPDEIQLRRSLDIVLGGHVSIPAIRHGRSIRRQLRHFRRYSPGERLRRYGARLVDRLSTMGRRRQKPRAAGGVVIAIVGADASGKSTLVRDTVDWLGGALATRHAHVGKPPTRLETLPFRLARPAARRMATFLKAGRASTKTGSASAKGSDSVPRMKRHGAMASVRALSLAWERNRLVRRIHRWARKGYVVVCDRYTSLVPGAMDSPRLAADSRAHRAPRPTASARLERRLYAANPPPDLVIRLTVPIEVALERNRQRGKGEVHSDEDLIARHEGFHRWRIEGLAVDSVTIDTSEDLEATRAAVRTAVIHLLQVQNVSR